MLTEVLADPLPLVEKGKYLDKEKTKLLFVKPENDLDGINSSGIGIRNGRNYN